MMNERQRVKELEQLSAYLDGELNEAEQKQIESRLASEAELHEMYEGLRKTKLLFSRLRRFRAPRSFALTPEMVKVRKQKKPFFTGVRWATSVAAILLVVMFGAEYLLGNMFAASAPMAAEPVFESMEMAQDTDTLAEDAPNSKAAEPEPLIIWGVPGYGGGGGDVADGLGGGGGEAGISEASPLEPAGGGGMPPEELPTEPPPSDERAFDDTEGESLILGINTDQAGEVMDSGEEETAESPSPSWLTSLTPLNWAEIGLGALTLTGIIILLVKKRS